jgi:hypothetical protein
MLLGSYNISNITIAHCYTDTGGCGFLCGVGKSNILINNCSFEDVIQKGSEKGGVYMYMCICGWVVCMFVCVSGEEF